MSGTPMRPDPEYIRALADIVAGGELSRLQVGDIVLERTAQVGQAEIAELMQSLSNAAGQGMGDGRDPRLEDLAYPDGRAPNFKRTG
jgi:hypothetical protein